MRRDVSFSGAGAGSAVIMCSEEDPVAAVHRLFGSEVPRGHPRSDQDSNLKIPVRIVHAIKLGIKPTKAVKNARAEAEKADRSLSIQQVWSILRAHRVEAEWQFDAWVKTLLPLPPETL